MSAVDQSPIRYFPVNRRPFEFKVGLRALPPAGQGRIREERVFQLDAEWPRYRDAKLAARRERVDKYICRQQLTPSVASRVIEHFLCILPAEYPDDFVLTHDGRRTRLDCHLTGESLVFDGEGTLVRVEGDAAEPPYADALDALCCQIQEDVAVIHVGDGVDVVSYLHLCLPGYWAATEKIGGTFAQVHAPVPAMERINAQAGRLVDTLIQKGPFERFAWGITTDDRLNHHPESPSEWNERQWYGRSFDPVNPVLYLRVERQTTTGFPHVAAFLFTIRTYVLNVAGFRKDERKRLAGAIRTMPPRVRRYKGLDGQVQSILEWLETDDPVQGQPG